MTLTGNAISARLIKSDQGLILVLKKEDGTDKALAINLKETSTTESHDILNQIRMYLTQ